MKIKWRLVGGHQDKTGKSLDWWAKKNEQVDTQAKAFLPLCSDCIWPHITIRFLYEHWAIYFNGVKQSWLDKEALYCHMFSKRTLEYWKYHHNKLLPLPETFEIYWEPASLVIQRIPTDLKIWHAKFPSGHIGHNHHLFKWQ